MQEYDSSRESEIRLHIFRQLHGSLQTRGQQDEFIRRMEQVVMLIEDLVDQPMYREGHATVDTLIELVVKPLAECRKAAEREVL